LGYRLSILLETERERASVQPETPSETRHRALSSKEIAPGVARVEIVFVNAYLIDVSATSWVLVDTGLPNCAGWIRRAAQRRYGRNARPEAIILTHGHFDHAGSALALAKGWDVPIYAHPLEMPYLRGKSDYPPKDPTVGGVLAQMARIFPDHGYDFGDRVRSLPMNDTVPALPGWRAVHTPGHTAGHICLWREADRTLLAGDALATVNQDSPLGMVVQHAEFRQPPAPFTTDWGAVQSSVEHLSELRPATVSAGHGPPISGPHVATALTDFALSLRPPRHGRYVAEPAIADERGVVSVPPPAPDHIRTAAVATAIAAAVATVTLARRRNGSP